MVLFFSIVGTFLLVLLMVLFFPSEVGFTYRLDEGEQAAKIRYKLLGIPFSINLPVGKDEKKAKTKDKRNSDKAEKHMTPRQFIAFSKQMRHAYQEVKENFHELLSRLKRSISCREIYFNMHYGMKNPAATGLLNGAVWTAATLILKILDSVIHVEKKTLCIYPNFQKEQFCIHIKGTFRGKLFDVVYFGLKVRKLVKIINHKIDS